MAQIKKKLKKFGRYTWELFKSSLPSLFMYLCASSILLMLTMKGETLKWNSKQLSWTVVCALGALAYHALVAWASGGTQYEMLVSGNIKRTASDAYGNEYKMSTHKEAKEYRPWKGFVIGAFSAMFVVLTAIVFGCNQTRIDAQQTKGGLGVLMIILFFLSGWSILPFYYMNGAGISVSYFLSGLMALLPIAVSGGMYIAGAYSRRNKAIRQQMLADKEAAAAAEREKNKKINYGGLPGTKPKKKRK